MNYELIKEFKKIPISIKPNYIKIPVTLLKPTEENAKLFNDILESCVEDPEMKKIEFTSSGGISVDSNSFSLPCYGYTLTRNSAELVILILEGMLRIQFRSGIYEDDSNFQMSGRKAFMLFKELLLKEGINLEKYAIINGEKIKESIQSPLIALDNDVYRDCVFQSVHHIDFHSSYGAGLANTYPEFRPLLEKLYAERKKNKAYKAVLNFTIGFMQSKWTGYRFAQLAKAAIEDNNKRVRELAKALEKSGRIVIMYNTDGIWYYGDVYHGPGEGTQLGEWINDHIDCKFRAKSAGVYEFIEGGKYTPIVRGFTNLDKIKSRDDWQWGDIYQQTPVYYYLTSNGIKYEEEKNG